MTQADIQDAYNLAQKAYLNGESTQRQLDRHELTDDRRFETIMGWLKTTFFTILVGFATVVWALIHK